jgi:hypothetical protein
MLGFAPLSSLAISESGTALEPEGIASAPGPLGAFLGIAYITLSGLAQAESPLGAALLNGTHHAARVQVQVYYLCVAKQGQLARQAHRGRAGADGSGPRRRLGPQV